MMLLPHFFAQDACQLAMALLGKVLRVKYQQSWLAAKIIETEAYYLHDKASHASLGYTPKRKALFMSPGTIYMYYARGGDSLNVSAQGDGNAVLIKAGIPYLDKVTSTYELALMQQLNPIKGDTLRHTDKLCAGQVLLCRALGLKVPKWDQQQFDRRHFYIEDVGYVPHTIIQTTRLGIPLGRDEHLPYRYIDQAHVRSCSSNPLTKRHFRENKDFRLLQTNSC